MPHPKPNRAYLRKGNISFWSYPDFGDTHQVSALEAKIALLKPWFDDCVNAKKALANITGLFIQYYVGNCSGPPPEEKILQATSGIQQKRRNKK